MASALDTRIRQFLRWWGGELRGCLPRPLAQLLFPAPSRIELTIAPGRIALEHHSGRQRRLLCECHPDPNRAAEVTAELAVGLGRIKPGEVVLRLPREQVLEPEVDVPSVAAGALAEVLAQEMDRKTPFSAADVHFDYRVTGSDPAEDRLHVKMRVARRSDVDGAVRLAKAIGLAPSRVDATDRPDEGYNLLPEAERARPSRLMPRLIGAAAVLTAALAAGAIYVTFDQAERELALIEAEVAHQRGRAAEVRALQDRGDALKDSALALIEARRARVTAAELVDEVTRRIPEQHWLYELRSRGDKLYLFGYSPAATQVLRDLEASPILSGGSFAAPLVAGPEPGLERFTILVDVGARPAAEGKP